MIPTATARPVTAETFAQEVVQRSMEVPVLVDFWADWCAPCKTLSPILDRLAADYAGVLDVVKVNVDEEQMIAQQLGIRSLPTVKLISQGRIVDEFVGAQPEAQIREMLARHLPDAAAPGMGAEAEAEPAEERLARLEAAHQAKPDDAETSLELAEVLAMHGDTTRASDLLASLPVDAQTKDGAERVRAYVLFADALQDAPERAALEARLTETPDDHRARHQLAARLFSEGEHEAALEQLLELLARDRSFDDAIARRSLVAAFNILGSTSELTGRYRRRMSSVLL
ncbi:MAG: thioredoxin [Gammaproteobacteria bacterium]|nr:thioredoxin [Gammaproteobacteria bacterium]TVQ48608.1 MAG: thioredoxin [Gammaproteobacteria bacterium]